jgi:hypothetical protein
VGIENEQDYSRVDYMLTEEDWNESKKGYKSINESLKDLVEECFDKMEKLAGKNEIPSLDVCKSHIHSFQLLTQAKQPSDPQIKAIYSAWVSLRKKHNNPLMRIFWRKPDPNDNSPNASFRSRVAEKMQTRRKNKNDNSNYMKLKLLSKEIFAGRTIIGKVMEREKLKLAMLDLDYFELRQTLKRKTEPEFKCEDLKEFMENYNENTRVEFPKNLVEPVKSEADEEMKDEISSINNQSNGTSKRGGRKNHLDTKLDPDLMIGSQPVVKNQSDLDNSKSRAQYESQHLPQRSPMPLRVQKVHEPITVDATTVMQIGVMFKKFYYFGVTADRNRIKINNHKPIKKEEYLNLTQNEIEEEQYQRVGIKPKPVETVSSKTSDVKYTIFRARNGRVLIKRKPVGGDYEALENTSHTNFSRIKPETANNLKRIRSDLDALDTFNKNSHIPVLQHEVNKRFKQFDFLEDSEPDEDTTNDDLKEDDEDDNYANEFISRFRKRKGHKDLHISVPL